MDLEFKKKIEERMEEIPKALADAIRASGWEKIVFDLGRKHSLHVDDIGELQNELILVLVGIVHPDEFRSIVVNEIGIPSSKADVLIEEMNTQINEKIKNALKQEIGEPESDEESLNESEQRTMRSAGIELGSVSEPEASVEEEIDVSLTSEPTQEANPIRVNVAPSVSKPSGLAPSQVFKTKTSEISADGKPKNFFDPYREPVE